MSLFFLTGGAIGQEIEKNSEKSGFPQMTKSGNNLVFAWTDDSEKTIRVGMITLWVNCHHNKISIAKIHS
jgi:hypothetical protein